METKLTSSPWKPDKEWADGLFPEVDRVLRKAGLPGGKIISVCPASEEADRKRATDYDLAFEVETDRGTIACRIRRSTCGFRDLTIRWRRTSGAKTEWAKIFDDGHARWYLYAWANPDGVTFESWIVVDLDALRARVASHCWNDDLVDGNAPERANGDGTFFRAIPAETLAILGCLVAVGGPLNERLERFMGPRLL
jgi:hypothetical protein